MDTKRDYFMEDFRALSDKEIFKRLLIRPGIPSFLIGLVLVCFLELWFSVPNNNLSFFLKILFVVAAFFFPFLLFVGTDFFVEKGKLVCCPSCKKVRNTDYIEREKKRPRCEKCFHFLN